MNILHITDMPPCENYTAGIVQMHLYRFLLKANHRINCFAIVDPTLKPKIPEDIVKKIDYKIKDKPRENYGCSKWGSVASFLGNNYNANIKLPKIKKEIITVIKKNEIDLVWSVVQGQTMIKLINSLAKTLKIPYVVEVWDPPQWWLAENKFDKYTYKSVMKAFGHLLKNAQCCMAASHNMAIEYSKMYSANTITVIPSLSEELQTIPKRIVSDDEFVIGFAGQLYARDEFMILIKALNALNWQYNGKKIRIVLYGAYFNFNFDCMANIILRGWVKQEQVLDELAGMDLLYCPYWFDQKFSIIARLSFPSKLTTYLKTKTPVLIHAPYYASTSKFVTDRENAYVCNNQSIDCMKEKMEYIIKDDNKRIIGSRGYELYKNNLTAKKMQKNFFAALKI